MLFFMGYYTKKPINALKRLKIALNGVIRGFIGLGM